MYDPLEADRRQEQDRLRDEEYRLEQDRLRDEQRLVEDEELRREEVRLYNEYMRKEEDRLRREDYDEDRRREYDEERLRDAEAQEGFDSDLPPINIPFDQNLYLMYLDMASWMPPVGVDFIPMLALDPPRLYSLVRVFPAELLSVWGRPRCGRDFIHKCLDGVVAHLRDQNAKLPKRAMTCRTSWISLLAPPRRQERSKKSKLLVLTDAPCKLVG